MTTRSQTALEGSKSENAAALRIVECTTAAGHRFYCRPETDDIHIATYVVDNNEYDLPHQFDSDDVIIDIGAHIGCFAYAALLRGAGKVFAYESHPTNYHIARMNLARFGDDRLSFHNVAVWRSDLPSQTLYNEDIKSYTNTGGISLLWNNDGLPVQSISLDEILSQASNGFQKSIRLLKIDCEGSEYPILFTSKWLDFVEEIRGEYHEMKPEQIPDRAKIKPGSDRFDRFALKEFFESKGWPIDLDPKGEADGLFHARRRQPGVFPGTISRPPATGGKLTAQRNQKHLMPGADQVIAARDDSSNQHDTSNQPQEAAPDIDVKELMARIREAVALRESRGNISFIAASRELYTLLSVDGSANNSSLSDLLVADISSQWPNEPGLSLQPRFERRANDRYELDELLQYHDTEFISSAYRAILKRDPDEVGLQGYLARLRSGRRNKIDILASLRFSPEGRRADVEIVGLKARAWFRRIYLLPVVGYLAELSVSLVRLPVLVRNHRQLENHLIAQQEMIAQYLTERLSDHKSRYLDRTNQVAARLAQSLTSSLSSLRKQHAEIAALQQQQVAALFRNQQRPLSTPAFNPKSRISERRWHKLSAAFLAEFRGTPEAVKAELKPYLSLLKDSGITEGVLDLGCGRGEWLELLTDNSVQGVGIETNSVLAAVAREKQLDVVESDAVEYLRGLKSESLKAITAFHLIEHLEFPQLVELVDEIRRTLKPGGLVIMETPNPKNLVVGACNFYSDPTHRRPLFPDTVQFLLNQLGFERVRIEYLHPVPGSPFDNEQPGSQELNTWLFGSRDFAAIAWKP